jgi:hypothetical protein
MKENQWVVCLDLNLAVSMDEKTVVQSVVARVGKLVERKVVGKA